MCSLGDVYADIIAVGINKKLKASQISISRRIAK